MRVTIGRGWAEGRAIAPPSKSYTHRALFLSSLARGRSRVLSPLHSDDTTATRRVLEMIGVPIRTLGEGFEVHGGSLGPPETELHCGESATTLRLGSAVCSIIEGEAILTGASSLLRRPVEPLLEGLRQMGVECSGMGGFPPVRVRGGRLLGGEVSMRGDISSQFVSAILLIAPLAERPTNLTLTTPLESKPYVCMTMEAQRRFGVEIRASEDMRHFQTEVQEYGPTDFKVEGDWSSAAYLLAAGATAGRVVVENLDPKSLQADAAIIEYLRGMGASVKVWEEGAEAEMSNLRGLDMEVSDCPDLFPILASLSAAAEGRSIIRGVRRLEYKESNRVESTIEGLRAMGIRAYRRGDEVIVEGGRPRGGVIDPRGDHRLAMAFSILGLIADGETTILGAECVSKSYPLFWEALEGLGVSMRRS